MSMLSLKYKINPLIFETKLYQLVALEQTKCVLRFDLASIKATDSTFRGMSP